MMLRELPEMKFVEDAQESDGLSGDKVEIETVSENMKH